MTYGEFLKHEIEIAEKGYQEEQKKGRDIAAEYYEGMRAGFMIAQLAFSHMYKQEGALEKQAKVLEKSSAMQ